MSVTYTLHDERGQICEQSDIPVPYLHGHASGLFDKIEQQLEGKRTGDSIAGNTQPVSLGREERYCYGISLSPGGGKLAEILRGLDQSFLSGPDTVGRETLSKEQAVAALREHEQEGLCHTVWTFRAPFIGGICNCDRTDCLAMRCTVTHGIPVMFRAEYVASVDPDVCTGCRQCMRVCQFGALSYSASNHKVAVDERWCYGCGICRSSCPRNAIRLQGRPQVPAAANRW